MTLVFLYSQPVPISLHEIKINVNFGLFFTLLGLVEHGKNVSYFVRSILATVSHSAGYTTHAFPFQLNRPYLLIQLFYLRATAVEHIFESRRKYLRHPSHKKKYS